MFSPADPLLKKVKTAFDYKLASRTMWTTLNYKSSVFVDRDTSGYVGVFWCWLFRSHGLWGIEPPAAERVHPS